MAAPKDKSVKQRETRKNEEEKPVKKARVPPPAPKPFTSEVQPSPEAKSEGWKKLRAQRLLTQAILKHMTSGSNLEDYIESLYKNAKKGNPKAIETINKGVEDDIIKIAQTDAEGNPINFVLDERYKNSNPGTNDSGLPT